MESDPLLKKLITQGNEVDEKSVPLTLYTPFGRVSGYTTTGDDFHRYSERELQQLSEVQSVFEGSADDDDYVHLASAKSWTSPVEQHACLRIRLADVMAWTIGLPD
ncbi:hypothetical protein [Mycobacterium sp.]|uniref:hypothetical protein n=1 Tax=Mycobacterium sp. TaxID=1785 RepID=UPI003C70CEDF